MDPSNVLDHFDMVTTENGEIRRRCKKCKKEYEVDLNTLCTHLTNCKDLSVYARMYANFKPSVWFIKVVCEIGEHEYIETGTGFSVSNNGLVMTCAHVVDRVYAAVNSKDSTATWEIKLHTLDNSFFGTAKIVYSREKSDLALLKVNANIDCNSLFFSSNELLSVGQPLMTIGHPSNFVGSCLVGNVSYRCMNVRKSDKKMKSSCDYYDDERQPIRKYRMMGDVWNIKSFFLTDNHQFQKSLNPSVPIIQSHGLNVDSGNSGGPVFDLNGQIVGMIHGSSNFDDISIHVTELTDFMDEYLKSQRSGDRPSIYATQTRM